MTYFFYLWVTWAQGHGWQPRSVISLITNHREWRRKRAVCKQVEFGIYGIFCNVMGIGDYSSVHKRHIYVKYLTRWIVIGWYGAREILCVIHYQQKVDSLSEAGTNVLIHYQQLIRYHGYHVLSSGCRFHTKNI